MSNARLLRGAIVHFAFALRFLSGLPVAKDWPVRLWQIAIADDNVRPRRTKASTHL